MEKMVMIFYNEAIDIEVMRVLEECKVNNYTKALGAFGRGSSSGIHLGDDIWPGRNNILYVACEKNEAQRIIACIKELRKSLGREGVKAFVLPLEDKT